MLLHLLWLWVLYWRGLHLFISEFVGVSRGCCGASGVQECFIVLVMRLGLPKSYVGCFQRLHAKRYVCIWWIIGIGSQINRSLMEIHGSMDWLKDLPMGLPMGNHGFLRWFLSRGFRFRCSQCSHHPAREYVENSGCPKTIWINGNN